MPHCPAGSREGDRLSRPTRIVFPNPRTSPDAVSPADRSIAKSASDRENLVTSIVGQEYCLVRSGRTQKELALEMYLLPYGGPRQLGVVPTLWEGNDVFRAN